MHNCEEFRERITEHIIDREDIAAQSEFRIELLTCSSCSEFYVQSREMMDALDGVDLSISESQWNGIETRLCHRIEAERTVLRKFGDRPPLLQPKKWGSVPEFPNTWRPFVAAAALLLITVALARVQSPTVGTGQVASAPAQAVYVEHSVPLDPVTVDFLQESELLLRNVMKMSPGDVDDLADAKRVASEQLAGLDQRKEAAAEVPPVVSVMETYETILRDLRNVSQRSADEDIDDIRKRIQQNGLIANMKAFQPRVSEVSFSLR